MERTDLEQWKSREVARLLALVETQRRYYQDIVALLPVGLVVLSAELEVILANAAARKTLGLRPGDPLPRTLDHFLPGGLLARVPRVLDTGAPDIGIVIETEKHRLRVAVVPIRSWDTDAAQEALLTIEDVSDIVATPVTTGEPSAEPARLEPGAEVQGASAIVPPTWPSLLVDNLNAVVWAVELPSMRFVYVSPYAEALLGVPVERWTSAETFWSDRVYEEDRASVIQGYRTAIEKAQPHSCEFRALTADGRILWLRESARLFPAGEGEPGYLIGITVDATERRLLEDQFAQSERVDAISKLASRMAHDLNNMLMILTGYGEELLNHLPAGSPLRPDIQEILTAAERMSGLTAQLLAFARKQPAATDTVELEPMLASIARRLGARDARVSIELKLSDEHSWVPANVQQFEQVVTAIVDRVRPAPGGECSIVIETSHSEIREDTLRSNEPLKPGVYAITAIAVPGPVPQGDERVCLFECLVPGREPWDESAAALSRAYGMVRQWGGDLAVSSGPNGACVYRIFLPRLEARPAAEPAVAPVAAAEPEATRPTIFVVEDEAGIRALVRKILRRQNYEVLEAANGEEALAVCHQYAGKIDLLITDVIMPEMGGRELADRLRQQGRVTKVLFVSGYTDDASIYAEPLPPGSAFLQKPFTLGSLLDKVREVLAAPAA